MKIGIRGFSSGGDGGSNRAARVPSPVEEKLLRLEAEGKTLNQIAQAAGLSFKEVQLQLMRAHNYLGKPVNG
jgi:DNA-binding CsgD family transcriptional regulator